MEKILTDRVQLSPVTDENVKQLHQIWTLPGVRQYLWDDRIISLQETKEIVDRSKIAFKNNEYGVWVARLKNNPSLIGFSGYWPFFEPPQIQLIYGLDPKYWKQGLGSEIARSMIEYGFNKYKFKTIYAACDTANLASIALMDRIEMEFYKQEQETIFYRKTNL